LLLSLFCGAGGLDLGFERAGFEIGLAFDKKEDSVKSYNHNRNQNAHGHCADVRSLSLHQLDDLYGAEFRPLGIIGGPPCQSFSRATSNVPEEDPRHELPLVYAALLAELNRRAPGSFFLLENVPGLRGKRHIHRLKEIKKALTHAGFTVFERVLNAKDYNTPQNRERLFLVGLNTEVFRDFVWQPPPATTVEQSSVNVRTAIEGLAEPQYFQAKADPGLFPVHRNHWCMRPKSKKFVTPGSLIPGERRSRSFRTLAWDEPSLTVAYGNREVHIHPNCHRRLSVYEAMLLQGFPFDYELIGNLSSQFAQVSEAVPPPLAHAVAAGLHALIHQD